MSDAQIPRGIASDPDVRPTDEAFWKNAKVVWPTPKNIVTMITQVARQNRSLSGCESRR